MWLMDTDHLSVLERGGNSALMLQLRLGQVPAQHIGTTIVNYEEQMRGWMSRVAQAKTPYKVIESYALLQHHIGSFRNAVILPYDERSAAEFEHIHQLHLRIGTKDARIAAICLAHGATLLTRNRKDFEKVPGLLMEDWTQ